jgi:hypothetical protein
MAEPVEIAVDTYIRAWRETDAVRRAELVEACFSEDGRFVTRGGEYRGRSALLALMARIHADPRLLRIRIISAIDARGSTFRFRAAVDNQDGSSAEALDVGELDANGRISLVLTFAGALADTPA